MLRRIRRFAFFKFVQMLPDTGRRRNETAEPIGPTRKREPPQNTNNHDGRDRIADLDMRVHVGRDEKVVQSE